MIAVVRALWRASLAEELQYRGNLVASIVGTLFWMAMALLTLAVFFHQTATLGGWEFWEVVALLGIFNALGGLIEAVVRPGLTRLVEDVRSGALDLILAKPVESQTYVSFRRLDVWRLTDFVTGLGLCAFGVFQTGRLPTAAGLLAFALAFCAAALVLYAFCVALMSTAFWFVSVENLSVVFDTLYEGARYPVSAYPGALRFLFVYLIPIAWTTTIPAASLSGRLRPAVSLVACALAVLALLLTRLLWRHALRRYTSAGG